MLPTEIKPFADSNRRELEKIRLLLIKVRATDSLDVDTNVELDAAMDMIPRISRSFNRFEACLKDEQDTKNRYEAERRDARLEKMRAARQ